ncbi:hypothetical protein KNU56_gp54 [Gordonia phage Arri]|uniref:Uncharacterized protein n=1 Tax=Gordonia phage Arri TaxID=2588127 RepID=A0A4Y5U0F6_9CAUD|nr:hypothetical protein KNU56_gp54 [Gordonia phage Arri]QDB74831.1 hypothetical protein SEA_ARRI_54 [Gordonia phage Arri]
MPRSRMFLDDYQRSQLRAEEQEAYDAWVDDVAERRADDFVPVDNFDPTPSIHW